MPTGPRQEDHFVELELQLVPSEQGACCDGSRHDEVENPVLVALDHARRVCYVSKWQNLVNLPTKNGLKMNRRGQSMWR